MTDMAQSNSPAGTQAGPRLVLLSGIPGTGKSTYGRWLAQRHGVLHLDIENGDLERHNLAQAWGASVVAPAASPQPIVDALRRLNRHVAFDWGYPPVWLPFVMAMHRAGVTTWWFDGDRAAARRRFLKRGTVSVQALDIQMQGIAAVDSDIRTFYGERIVEVIGADGIFTDPDVIYRRMFLTGQ